MICEQCGQEEGEEEEEGGSGVSVGSLHALCLLELSRFYFTFNLDYCGSYGWC